MAAALPPAFSAPFTQLWVMGDRAIRARSPNIQPQDTYARGYSTASVLTYEKSNNSSGFIFKGNDIKAEWAGSNASVLAFAAWTASWYTIKAVDAHKHTVLFNEAKVVDNFFDGPGGKRYIVENLPELLDAEGEWYADFHARKVTYILRASDTAAAMAAVAPRLETVIAIDGVRQLVLSNVTVSYGGDGGDRNRATHGLVEIGNAVGVSIAGCVVEHGGGAGILTKANIRDLSITRTRISDVGSDGILMTSEQAQQVTIEDTVVSDTGMTYFVQPAGVHLRGNSSIALRHSDVSHGPYACVRVGWQPGWPQHDASVAEEVFDVSFNRLHDCGLGILSDFAGVFLSSNDNKCFQSGHQGCSVRAGVAHNIISAVRHFNYGGSGVYMDEQVGGVRIEKNTIFDIAEAGVYFHCGTNNSAINNVIHTTGARLALVKSCNSGGNPTYPNLPRGFTWTRNIGYMEGGETVATDKDFTSTSFTRNLYFSTSNPTGCCTWPAGESWDGWHGKMKQENGTIANVDPMFVDPLHANYELKPGSPAQSIGWQTIDYASIGPRAVAL